MLSVSISVSRCSLVTIDKTHNLLYQEKKLLPRALIKNLPLKYSLLKSRAQLQPTADLTSVDSFFKVLYSVYT